MGIPVPGDGKPLGTSFPVNVLPGAAGLVSERPPAQNGQPLRAARPIVSTFFNISKFFQVFLLFSRFLQGENGADPATLPAWTPLARDGNPCPEGPEPLSRGSSAGQDSARQGTMSAAEY